MAKCYIIACVVCGKLFDATGRNAITCSSTCRVWLKRHPEYSQLLREICRKLGITPFDMLRAEAARFLRPYFDSRIASGEFTWKDFQTEMACVLEEFAIKEAGEACHEGEKLSGPAMHVYKVCSRKDKHGVAWQYEDGDQTKTVALLKIPPVDSPQTAVKVAIAAKGRQQC